MYIMNIFDFLVISIVFVLLSFIKDDNISLTLLKPLVMTVFIVFYYKKIKEDFSIQCYVGHEPAKALDSYKSDYKPWCTYTGKPDTSIKRKDSFDTYNVFPHTNLTPDQNVNKNIMNRYIRSYREINETPHQGNHPKHHLDESNYDKYETDKQEPDDIKYIDLDQDIDFEESAYANIPKEVLNYSVLNKTITDNSDFSKKYKTSLILIDIYKPVMRGLNINDYYKSVTSESNRSNLFIKPEEVEEPEEPEEQICSLSASLYPKPSSYQPVKQDSCLSFEQSEGSHYHTEGINTDKTKFYGDITLRNNRDENRVLLYFVENDNERILLRNNDIFNKFTKKLLKNNISLVVINYNFDGEKRFEYKYSRINYVIQHFKRYSSNYKFNVNRFSARGKGISALICFMFTQYSIERLLNIERLMGIKRIYLRQNPSLRMVILDNPLLSIDNCERSKILNYYGYIDNAQQVYGEANKKLCTEELKEILNVTDQQLKSNNVKELIKNLNILNFINDNRNYSPVFIQTDKIIFESFTSILPEDPENNIDISVEDLREDDELPLEGEILYKKIRDKGIIVKGQIPYFNIKDSDRVNFVKTYL